jgi:hypothetical protein
VRDVREVHGGRSHEIADFVLRRSLSLRRRCKTQLPDQIMNLNHSAKGAQFEASQRRTANLRHAFRSEANLKTRINRKLRLIFDRV